MSQGPNHVHQQEGSRSKGSTTRCLHVDLYGVQHHGRFVALPIDLVLVQKCRNFFLVWECNHEASCTNTDEVALRPYSHAIVPGVHEHEDTGERPIGASGAQEGLQALLCQPKR